MCRSLCRVGTVLGLLALAGRIAAQEIATLKPEATVTSSDCLAFSPDGKTLVVGSFFKTVTLWDVPDRKPKATLAGHTGPVTSVAVSPDGKLIATASWDQSVILWDGNTREKLAALTGHDDWVTAVAFAPDGKTLVSGSKDKTIKVWQVEGRKLLKTLTSPERLHGPINTLAFSPDGKQLAAPEFFGNIDLWDVDAGKHQGSLKQEEVKVAVFTADGKHLVAAGSDTGVVRVWDVAKKEVAAELKGNLKAVTALAVQPKGGLLATGGDDGVVKVWDVTAKKELKTIDAHKDSVKALAFTADGATLATAGDAVVKLWDTTKIGK